jgi:large subunit ribosomal protein L25
MPTILNTQVGRGRGSAASRRMRRESVIPAVLYGRGMTPVSVSVDRRDLRLALSGPAGVNTILELHVDGTAYPAIVKDMQRDPVKRTVSHVDFQQIDLSEEIVMAVPVRLTGNAKAVLQDGGFVDLAVDRIEVRAAANNVPNEIVVDVSAMTLTDVIRVSDVALPTGVSAAMDADTVVVTALSTKVESPQATAAPTEGATAGAPTTDEQPKPASE